MRCTHPRGSSSPQATDSAGVVRLMGKGIKRGSRCESWGCRDDEKFTLRCMARRVWKLLPLIPVP